MTISAWICVAEVEKEANMSAVDLTHFLLPSSRLATDVIFSVGEERIPAHKVTMSRQIFRPIDLLLVCQIYWQGILAGASQAFESFFFGPFSIQRREVMVEGVSTITFTLFLHPIMAKCWRCLTPA